MLPPRLVLPTVMTAEHHRGPQHLHCGPRTSIPWELQRPRASESAFQQDPQVSQVHFTVCKALVYNTGSKLTAHWNPWRASHTAVLSHTPRDSDLIALGTEDLESLDF